MDIEPDTKDWTWVLSEPCPDCGFDTRAVSRDALPALIADIGARWADAMADPEGAGIRPAPTTWSRLEYACHVRDVLALATYRIGLMRDEDVPHFANWDQDATAVEERYGEQDPVQVREDLAREAEVFAAAVADVPADAWSRRGVRGDGADFTIESFTRYLVHDPIHHLTDVTGRQWG